MARKSTAAPGQTAPEGPQFVFIQTGAHVHALPAKGGALVVGGVIHQARAPRNADERAALRAAQKTATKRAVPTTLVRRMANTITQRTSQCGLVQRQDFHQAGIPDSEIDSNMDAALRMARKADPMLDSIKDAA